MLSSIFDRWVQRCILEVSSTFFPENDLNVPNYQQADVPGYTWTYLHTLPKLQRLQLKALFIILDIACIFLGPSFVPFNFAGEKTRIRFLTRLKKSNIYYFQMLFDGIKAHLTMMYLSRPIVTRHLGEYRLSKVPGDDYPIEIRSAKNLENGNFPNHQSRQSYPS